MGTSAEVVEWQTRTFEGRVGVSPCGFKSRLRHQKILPTAYPPRHQKPYETFSGGHGLPTIWAQAVFGDAGVRPGSRATFGRAKVAKAIDTLTGLIGWDRR